MIMKKRLVLDAVSIIVGNILLAAGVAFFIIPNNILTGGVAGLSIALSPFIKLDIELMITIIIIINFVLGYLFLGKKFALKTLASSILYPVLLKFMGFLNYAPQLEPMLASIYGGIITGLGIGIVFRVGSSTGGMDIPPLILGKYTKVKSHTWLIVVDGLTILLGLSTFGLNDVLVGLLSAYTMSKMVNAVQTFGGQQAKQVFIITTEIDQVLTMIFKDIDRGATVIDAHGGYTKEKRPLIMTVLMTEQYARLEKLVKAIDPDAFLIVSDATEVHGHGFYEK
ncbi:MAG: YitT family protein [Erysipelothrix sp.]|nr:YitT family protein [Erysipelothrix sp.]